MTQSLHRCSAWSFGLLVLASILPYQTNAAEEGRSQLIVVVSVDQFVYEYLERFHRNFAADGLVRRCESSGAWFANCHHQHAFTVTAPGHAVLLTGAYPSETGIVSNDWFDRTTGKTVYCVSDPDSRLIGNAGGDQPVSPRNLRTDTLGDRLKLASGGRSKIFGVAIKDRASILMVGRGGDAAFWMSNGGHWITSDFYAPKVPGYLEALSAETFGLGGRKWERLLPAEAYTHGAIEDSTAERPVYGMTADFPHVLPAADDRNYIKQLAASPFGNDVTLAAAFQILLNEKLGQDEHPDLLAINLSSNDYVGHSFGPHSLEVEDMTYRTDVALGKFIDLINEQLAGRPWTFALTADHGVAPIPELARERFHLDAGRGALGPTDRATGTLKKLHDPLEQHLRYRLAVDADLPPLVQVVVETEVYLHSDHPALRGEAAAAARRIVRDWLLTVEPIAVAATREDLQSDDPARGLLAALRRSYHPARSGDVLFALRPYYIEGGAGTTHGSPWPYDSHVPLLLLSQGTGADKHGVQPGHFEQRVSTAALAPTLARLVGVERPSGAQEEALVDILPRQ